MPREVGIKSTLSRLWRVVLSIRPWKTVLVIDEYSIMAEIKTIQVQGRGVESFADDLVTGLGVVFSRAATILRSVETKPTIGRFAFITFFF